MDDLTEAFKKAQNLLGGAGGAGGLLSNSPLSNLSNSGGLGGNIGQIAQGLLNNPEFKNMASSLTNNPNIRNTVIENLGNLTNPNLQEISKRKEPVKEKEEEKKEAAPIPPQALQEILNSSLVGNLSEILSKSSSSIDLKNQILSSQLQQQQLLEKQQQDLLKQSEELRKQTEYLKHQQEEIQKQKDFAAYQQMMLQKNNSSNNGPLNRLNQSTTGVGSSLNLTPPSAFEEEELEPKGEKENES